MKLITVEEHYDTDQNISQFNKYSEVKNNNPRQDQLRPDLVDFSNKIAYMDKNGIDMQVISDAGNSPQVLPDQYAVSGAHDQNETLAENISKFPDRFAGLATLPANVPDKAAEELEYAVTKLGMKGGIISGSINGQFLDDPKFEAIFAAADKLGTTLYLHPGVISNDQKAMLYDSKAYSALGATMMAGAMWGWHMEAGIQVLRIITAGLLEKYPNVKLATGHWGEFIPMFVERIDGFSPIITDLPLKFSDYYRRQVYLSPSGMFTAPQMQLALTEMGADHIMWSEDFPYVQSGKTVREFLEQADVTDEQREAIAHGTAEELFNL
ncbi:4-oxalomesaconate hydratase [Secundilactobacillus pentosiphilus]|uniref:4-oxalomesaconate hydratase n=1 Tax=Secundilactobacillus pentosiphilus TaxID=1714682 RepID=A0A1Z5ILM1_9LACO|nr:amidohydrolase family protein [Secundilactobacillus pentosiphilus]GAX02472.1 4-oxalomesaconate hydratase [Secundilactobacillus pentosiphilus]